MITDKNNKKKKKTRISDILYDNQEPMLEAFRMKLSPTAILVHLKNRGFPVRNVAYDRHKIETVKHESERLIHISDILLEDNQILEEMELEIITLWKDYKDEKDSYRRVIILEKIVIINCYLDIYYLGLRGIL